MKRNYILGGALVVLVVVLVLLNKPGSFKGSVADLRVCTKRDVIVSLAPDSPSGAVLNSGRNTPLAKFRVGLSGYCRLDISSLAGKVVPHGVSVSSIKAYESSHDLDSQYVYGPSNVSCASPTFTLLPQGEHKIIYGEPLAYTFVVRGDVDAVQPPLNGQASVSVDLYGPGGIGGVTTSSLTQTSSVSSGAQIMDARCR